MGPNPCRIPTHLPEPDAIYSSNTHTHAHTHTHPLSLSLSLLVDIDYWWSFYLWRKEVRNKRREGGRKVEQKRMRIEMREGKV